MKRHFDQTGFSLIELMLAVGISSILALVFGTMFANQNREMQAMSQKFLKVELETQLKNVLIKSDYCGCIFNSMNFDTTAGSEHFNSPLNSIPDSFTAPAPSCNPSSNFLIPPVGSSLSGTTIQISKIELTDIVAQGGGDYTGNISVDLDAGTLVRGLKSIKSPIAFSVDQASGTPTTRPFAGCASAGSAFSASLVQRSAFANGPVSSNCPAGYKLTQCHAEITSNDGQSLMFANHVSYTSTGGSLTGCSANMTDGGGDTYQLVLICVK